MSLRGRLDRLAHQYDADARRWQVVAQKPPFDYAAFEQAFSRFWLEQLADLGAEVVDHQEPDGEIVPQFTGIDLEAL